MNRNLTFTEEKHNNFDKQDFKKSKVKVYVVKQIEPCDHNPTCDCTPISSIDSIFMNKKKAHIKSKEIYRGFVDEYFIQK